jgi:hypothetical protein
MSYSKKTSKDLDFSYIQAYKEDIAGEILNASIRKREYSTSY